MQAVHRKTQPDLLQDKHMVLEVDHSLLTKIIYEHPIVRKREILIQKVMDQEIGDSDVFLKTNKKMLLRYLTYFNFDKQCVRKEQSPHNLKVQSPFFV